MVSERPAPEANASDQPALIRALDTLSASVDIDGLLQMFAETALGLGSASVVEIALIDAGDHNLVSDYVLHADGMLGPLFPDIGHAQLARAAIEEARPQLGFLADFDGGGTRRHVLVHPIKPGLNMTGQEQSPIGVVALGYAEPPSSTAALAQSLQLLSTCFAYRLQQLLAERLAERQRARIELIDEISAMVVREGSNELLFNTAVRRIAEVFDLDTVALYAGKPLTLRLLYGGRTTRLGTPVPGQVIARLTNDKDPVVIRDLLSKGRASLPPWVASGAQSEAVIPLSYRDRRIGVLDLYSEYNAAFDEVSVQILVTLARQLALLIVQERWDESDGAPADRQNAGLPAIKNRGTLGRPGDEGDHDSQRLQAAYDRLQEFAELKDQILQNISHELRTPLTLIKGYLELMMDGQMGDLLPEQRQSLEMVVRKADDVTRIVEEIVSLSPLNRLSLNYQRISVAELVAELALMFVQRTNGTKISWDFRPIDDDLYLSGDLAQIRQVFYNILDNSVKFSPEGGRIRVEAIPESAYVHLIFQDEGIGIPKPR
ncbi:MAG: GAF domain-containing sensor histidine kinase, partial [Anaerolineae bacterium]|nr:GAF domain-containing sensor histidine kinase [Anaerolineae bacterium]